jgi:hypothetical protein
VKHIKANVSSYNHDYGKADRNKIRQRIKTRAIFDIFFKLADGFIEPRSSPWSQAKLWLYLVLCVWTWVNRIMALRLAFLVCCALTGAGVKLLEAPVGATTVLITSNALVVLVMLLVFFCKETPSAVESSDTNEPHKVLEKLLEYEVPLQNIPSDPQKGENLVEAFKNSEGKIIVRDPDGYYLELCNCDVPTAFCLFKENAKEKKPGYVPKYKKLMDAI